MREVPGINLDVDTDAEWMQGHMIGDATCDHLDIHGKKRMSGAESTEIAFREKIFAGDGA
ncbi:MAG: hypothetical protein MAGBODY4_01344 [Candidatus Marinimicrobia bacterium]|nr:hypothetical protein [Candidatus Neomarinimicrobiota bacterium]